MISLKKEKKVVCFCAGRMMPVNFIRRSNHSIARGELYSPFQSQDCPHESLISVSFLFLDYLIHRNSISELF